MTHAMAMRLLGIFDISQVSSTYPEETSLHLRSINTPPWWATRNITKILRRRYKAVVNSQQNQSALRREGFYS